MEYEVKHMTKKEEFVEAYKAKVGAAPSEVDKTNPKQVKKFIKNLKTHKLVKLFREAVEESEETPDMGMTAFGDLFAN